MQRFARAIDTLNEWVGRIVSPIIIAMLLIGTYEVVARYVFHSPTIWAWEINGHLLCLFLSMAGGYALLLGRHVSVDILYSRVSVRTRAIMDLVTWPIFFLVCIIVIWTGTAAAIEATVKQEYVISSLRSPAYPDRWMIPIGTTLLLLQGVVKYLKDIATVAGKRKTAS
ncbi:MAG: TRAP transporter small permease subunit [Chloroflexi bacterium]|nr:TRAP transporter small permease subunit [Chloroflexota bacterium]